MQFAPLNGNFTADDSLISHERLIIDEILVRVSSDQSLSIMFFFFFQESYSEVLTPCGYRYKCYLCDSSLENYAEHN